MRLVIDIGNTRAKAVLMERGNVVHFSAHASDPGVLSDLAQGVSDCVYCSVRAENDATVRLVESLPVPVRRLLPGVRLPLELMYSTPGTLGMDRVAAAVGAWSQAQGTDILVIDVGTALTADFVSAAGEYMGGNISPGPELRFRALNEFTGRLPLVSAEGDAPITGYSTETAIRGGVMNGISMEIGGYISHFRALYPSLSVFLTGGASRFFEKSIKNGIFADDFLVFKGLDRIFNNEIPL